MSDTSKKTWTIGQYVYYAVVLGVIGVGVTFGGTGPVVVFGLALIALAIGLALVAAVAKGSQVGRN